MSDDSDGKDNVVSINKNDPQRVLPTELLENILKRIKSGDILSACVAYTVKDGEIGYGYSMTDDPYLMLSSVTLLHRRFECVAFGDPIITFTDVDDEGE